MLGRFRELLEATARDPAMLVYLDNWMSTVPNAPARFRAAAVNNRPRGINENYARELMELHTLGVDGGYTQKDVTEVARAFTGWTIENPRRGSGFRFEPRMHDAGPKTVLGHRIAAGGGESDGERVLDLLAIAPVDGALHRVQARAPAGRRQTSTGAGRSCRGPVPRHQWRPARGDADDSHLAGVLAPDVYAAKVKTPFEFVASALRAAGTEVGDARPIVRELREMGMPLYMCQPPTGYADTADAWVNTGALVTRLNYALKLAGPDKQHGAAAGRARILRNARGSGQTPWSLDASFCKHGAFAFVSLGFAPSFLARTARAAGASSRPKRLIAIFQRGAVDGLSMVVAVRRARLLPCRGRRSRSRVPAAAPMPPSTSTASSASTRACSR